VDINSVSIDAKAAVFIFMLAHIQGRFSLKIYPIELKFSGSIRPQTTKITNPLIDLLKRKTSLLHAILP
jgi:hypothetical protein